MKKLISTLFLILIVMSCSTKKDNSEKNVAIIENYIQAVEDLDYETMSALLDDEYIGIGPSYGDTIRKTNAVKNWKWNAENLYDSIDYTESKSAPIVISTGKNQGEWVSNWAQTNITYKNNNETVIIWSNSIYQIVNDKIVKSYTFYNEADALEQLGYTFINFNDF
ncbi:hypothetical protein [Formosa sp. PL04]|uniref:nuclear transport factor 2 family protein n=1 Tax=Formosa sp. PL04 TaxID=3081755 RepID=UPI002982626E|nr:hypothetical protein [Formosa sp. PL04]MDW5288936.1 hypothetical protein [Formosa sp. PL04]